MVSPERLTYAFIQSASSKGASVANWSEVTSFKIVDGNIKAVGVKDEPTGSQYDIEASCIVNASGCWADKLLGLVAPGGSHSKVARSKGIHIVIPQIHKTHALAMITKTKRHVYLLPWRGRTLCGTTDTPFKDDPDNFHITSAEIQHFIDELNDCHPALNLKISDVLSSYGGLRPLADPDGMVEDSYDASRKFEVVDHKKEGLANNLLSALGGKYTTSRYLAEQVVDAVFQKLGKSKALCKTSVTKLSVSPDNFISDYRKSSISAASDIDAKTIDLLITYFGADWNKVVDVMRSNPASKSPVCEWAPESEAHLTYSARSECVVHLDDALCRRSDLCTLGKPDRRSLEKCSDIVGDELNWDQNRKTLEIERIESILSTRCVN